MLSFQRHFFEGSGISGKIEQYLAISEKKHTIVGNRLLGWKNDKQVGNFLEVCGTSWRDVCKSPRCAEKCVMQVWTDMLLFQSIVESFFPRLLDSHNAQGIAWQVWKHWNMCKNIWDRLNVPIYIFGDVWKDLGSDWNAGSLQNTSGNMWARFHVEAHRTVCRKLYRYAIPWND